MLFRSPKNAFVAKFIGASNIVDGIMIEDFLVDFAGRKFECVDKGFEPNEDIQVVVRPEDIKIVDKDKGMLEGVVESETFKGVHYEMIVKENDREWLVHSTLKSEVGTVVGMNIFPEDIHIMKKVSD